MRARIIIDLKGLRLLGVFSHFALVKTMIGLAKAYFPELSQSVTIINAPFGFETLWSLISRLLNDRMRSKVCIVGSDYAATLKSHAGLDIALLPVSLGGTVPDADSLAPCLPVPRNLDVERTSIFIKTP